MIQMLSLCFPLQTCREMKVHVSSMTHAAQPCYLEGSHTTLRAAEGAQPEVQEALAVKSNILHICTVLVAVTAAETDFRVVYTISYPSISILGTSFENSKCQLFIRTMKEVYRIASTPKINKKQQWQEVTSKLRWEITNTRTPHLPPPPWKKSVLFTLPTSTSVLLAHTLSKTSCDYWSFLKIHTKLKKPSANSLEDVLSEGLDGFQYVP